MAVVAVRNKKEIAHKVNGYSIVKSRSLSHRTEGWKHVHLDLVAVK